MATPSSTNAASLIRHPTRAFFVGASGAGKTRGMVMLIKYYFAAQVNRVIGCGPTFQDQDTYDPIRHLVKPNDIYPKLTNKTLQILLDKLEAGYRKAKATGTEPEKILVFIDDMAGNSVIQGRRQGPFAQLATQVRHWGISLFVISQQPKCTDANFRDNAENIIVYRDFGEMTYKWLKEAYTALDSDSKLVNRVILYAWRGGKEDNTEMGQHFLFIHKPPRSDIQFFVDFGERINVT